MAISLVACGQSLHTLAESDLLDSLDPPRQSQSLPLSFLWLSRSGLPSCKHCTDPFLQDKTCCMSWLVRDSQFFF